MLRILMLSLSLSAALACASDRPVAIAVHGGAGSLQPGTYAEADEAAMRADIARALDAGHGILESGGSALDAVVAAVQVLEDSPHFNAGRGAVFNAEGVIELDASIMDGASRAAGAVAGVKGIRNPILAARAVMERSPHVMLAGEGAEAFAREVGLAFAEPGWFHTERRWQALEAAREREEGQTPDESPRGTVGAVALDRQGRLAAATSTGGMTNKRWGRIGDAPIIGAGTWADDRCAVSATGWGEFYIRTAAAHEICARQRYAGESIADAAADVVMRQVPALGGDGGVIAIDAQGRVAAPFNTAGMSRGYAGPEGRWVRLFVDAEEGG
ncbi:MAG TPA: isoaspartyl peptidase/L-asparaginase [Xanthomonadaceae bacterium]|nr:isoaspartyl peptidase/L-asparaginase [Xanthomonadaceae bacterium]